MATKPIVQSGVSILLLVCLSSACNTGWFGPHEDSCYKLETTNKKNWAAARDSCKQQGGHLAIIMSTDENEFLKQHIRSSSLGHTQDQIWMDGTDSTQEGTYIWEATGELLEIKDWGPGEPNQNAGDEDCLTFFGRYNFQWNDEHCDKAFPYMCEMEQNPVIG